MLRMILLLLVASAASAEFLELRVGFEDGGCAPCVESLRGRLERVRGMKAVEIDLNSGKIRMRLEKDNRARLAPLLSRIRQGGTKLTSVWIRAEGEILVQDEEAWFRPSGLTRRYPLVPADAGRNAPSAGLHQVRASVLFGDDSSAPPKLRWESIQPLGGSR